MKADPGFTSEKTAAGPVSGSAQGRKRDVAARRTTLSARDRYKLRLLVNETRFYMADPSLLSLARRGLVAPTGRTDDANRAEWTITAMGQEAFSAVENPLTAGTGPSNRLRA